ncbi:hypothetical protein SKAU_G00304640 [Synaphobranchus kaupii]|uniref:Uncharacterized protein n=1 Tax=Synaphobranchus kaupii TaxID=118154 RepID=A0A9Q1INM9_SYNKA|nr:hypothetical protein SKAU_G00304640 [Synaphobranchus kaupii]
MTGERLLSRAKPRSLDSANKPARFARRKQSKPREPRAYGALRASPRPLAARRSSASRRCARNGCVQQNKDFALRDLKCKPTARKHAGDLVVLVSATITGALTSDAIPIAKMKKVGKKWPPASASCCPWRQARAWIEPSDSSRSFATNAGPRRIGAVY